MAGIAGFHPTASAALLAALLIGLLPPLHAAPLKSGTQADLKAQAGVTGNLAVLARDRPKKCIEANQSAPDVRGWRKTAAQCAWQNRLQMRRWETDSDSNANSCLSKQALWWAWMRARSPVAPKAGNVAWDRAWSAQSVVDDSGMKKRVGIIVRTASGSWTATEWSWDPSPRAATRTWQAGRWKLLTDAAIGLQQASRKDAASQVMPLRAVWEKRLAGTAGEVLAENWLWERGGLCMRMETVGLSRAQLHLPYSKEDGRLEQRAAMQLRLARTYPKATWLTPFRLLPLPDPAARGGAKYEAIWIENATVKGQLWMPRKENGAVVRARIAVTLPATIDREADAAALAGIARSIDRELIGLATSWAFGNEH